MSIFSNNPIKKIWNIFKDHRSNNLDDSPNDLYTNYMSGLNPYSFKYSSPNDISFINTIYTRIANDVSLVNMMHIKSDPNNPDNYDVLYTSWLNKLLTKRANKDQTSRAFIRDVVQFLCENGVVCLFPNDTDGDINDTDNYKIYSLRYGKILAYRANTIDIDAYDDRTGTHRIVYNVPKSDVCIIENPFGAVMNDPRSIAQRLVRKLNQIDMVDSQISSGRMNMLIQLPYSTRASIKKNQAEARLKEIEDQLKDNKYGIAYLDAAEKVVQLNRPVDNNSYNTVDYLTKQMYASTYCTPEIIDGTATPEAMSNYYKRTVMVMALAIAEELSTKFISETAQSQGQSIVCYTDIFQFMPFQQLADTVDKLKRNEVVTSNELRKSFGMLPKKEQKANELTNPNIADKNKTSDINTNSNINDESSDNSSDDTNQNGE
jgi:hypothetical protein